MWIRRVVNDFSLYVNQLVTILVNDFFGITNFPKVTIVSMETWLMYLDIYRKETLHIGGSSAGA